MFIHYFASRTSSKSFVVRGANMYDMRLLYSPSEVVPFVAASAK